MERPLKRGPHTSDVPEERFDDTSDSEYDEPYDASEGDDSSASGGKSAKPSGGKSPEASGGNASKPSGGKSPEASGGNASKLSGGNVPAPTTNNDAGSSSKQPASPNKTWNEAQDLSRGRKELKKEMRKRKRKNAGAGRKPTTRANGEWARGATLKDIANTLQDNKVLPGMGANSGVPRTMLWAGKGCGDQRDTDAAQVSNSTDPDAWTKLGSLKFATCNDGDLVEWMIGWAIPVSFHRRFWGKNSPHMMGICADLLQNDDPTWPPEVKVYVDKPTKGNRKKIDIIETDITISRDPGIPLGAKSQEIHRNNLRDAIIDTYGAQVNNWTLEELQVAGNIISNQVENITQFLKDTFEEPEDDGQDQDMPDADDGSPGPAPKTSDNKGKGYAKLAKEKASKDKQSKDKDNYQPPVGKGNKKKKGNIPTYGLLTSIAMCGITMTKQFFMADTQATFLSELNTKRDEFRMRNDTKGAAAVAFLATSTVCLMAKGMGHDAAFIPPEPRNQREARRRPDADLWRAAEMRELETLWGMKTFEYVDRPANYDPLPLQFVYKLKVKDGDFLNPTYKARLVVMGHLQYPEEYGDTYAPTARLYVIRMLAAIAAQEGMTMKKFDLTGAYLVADMDKTVHVEIPGYGLPGKRALRLRKALYGGRSSGALYAKTIKAWFLKYGFKASSVDETLFMLTREKEGKTSTLLVSLYVDDGACITNDDELYNEFITALGSSFALSDVGTLTWHLGINFTHDLKNGRISLDQTAYIDSVLKRFNMEGAGDKFTPLPPHEHLTKDDSPRVPDKQRVKIYQQLIGSLMYAACATRPDIAFAVNTCSQFMQNPGEKHLQAAKHVLRYLKATKDQKLVYSRHGPEQANKLYGYVDADHAGCQDDRKSVGGYVLMLNGGAVSWASRKIKVVSISSFESEWYSASICGCEIAVLRRLMEEIDFAQKTPTVLFEDNAACVHVATSQKSMNPRSKHIDVRVFKLKEFVEDGILQLNKVESIHNIADCLTKALGRDPVDTARRCSMRVEPPPRYGSTESDRKTDEE